MPTLYEAVTQMRETVALDVRNNPTNTTLLTTWVALADLEHRIGLTMPAATAPPSRQPSAGSGEKIVSGRYGNYSFRNISTAMSSGE